MSTFAAISTDAKHFIIKENETTIGSIQYASWYTLKATMRIEGDETVYQFEPKGFWGTTIELKKEENVLLHFKMHWNGDIIIISSFDNEEIGYKLKHNGLLKTKYLLQDAEGKELLSLQPGFNWKKLTSDHTISTTPIFDALPHNKALLISAIHCANYYISMMSGVSAALA